MLCVAEIYIETKKDVKIANTYRFLGKMFLLKNNKSSLKQFKKSKSIMKKLFLTEHPLYAKILNNFGYANLIFGDTEKSEKYLEHSLRLCEKILPKNHQITLSVRNNLIMLNKQIIKEKEQAIID